VAATPVAGGSAAAPPGDAPSTASSQALDPEAHRKRSRRRGLIALTVVVILAVAAGSFAWWLGSGRNTTVPRVTGLTAEAAQAQLESEGLTVEFADEKYSEIVKAGEVISCDPEQGAEVRSGSTVTLTVSKGPERYDVPEVLGQSLGAAKKQLKARNLAVGEISRKYSETIETGIVMSATPEAGTSVRPDTPVDLVVSKGLPPVTVPDLTGDSTASAQEQLSKRNLTYKQTGEEYDNKIPAGAIISQDPTAGSSLAQGSTVSVVVSLGPPLVEVPDVLDMPLEEAIAELTAAGFKYNTYDLFGVSPLNRVATQDPEGGTQAPKGSVIRLGLV
jgi:beta-lactam-binding protein with PASTA domain